MRYGDNAAIYNALNVAVTNDNICPEHIKNSGNSYILTGIIIKDYCLFDFSQ